jgi:quinoprotein glucose dehydrogenase
MDSVAPLRADEIGLYILPCLYFALAMKNHRFPAIHIFSVLILFALSTAAQALPQIAIKPVFPNLQIERAVWMTEAPDDSGRFFVVGQAGKILIVKKNSDGADAKEFLNIEDRHPYFNNEDGLLSIAFHPGFKTNGLFYIYYTQENPADQNLKPQNYPFRSVVSEMKISATDPDKADTNSERILMEVPQPFWNHKGGELCFGPDGYLYLGLGDGGLANDPFGSGQSTTTLLAKILRIDVNARSTAFNGRRMQQLPYGIPSDNPFVDPQLARVGVRGEIFAYGLRNPWRYSFDRQTGDLWVGDVGQDLWEEIDVVTKGGNYGWSVRESAHPFKPGPPGAQYIEPVIEYPHQPRLQPQAMFPDHGIGTSVTGGYVYRGKKYPALDGVYIYADFTLGTIWGLRYDRDSKKVTAHGVLLQQKKNIASFAEDLDGELYVIMLDGHIYSITAP